MARILTFIIVSAGIFAFSWPSLRQPRSHGFFRFFAFETVLMMIYLNAGVWFREPFSPVHTLSWICLLGSIFLAVHGFYLLRAIGKPQGDFEATTQLVTQGAYRFIRHPLYASLLLVGLGAFLKDVSLTGLALLVALLAFLIGTARSEEAENLEHFGAAYMEYMRRTKMFVPFMF
jgi:protein-S-isoprenylcysteine O-methyltransferase Ste14